MALYLGLDVGTQSTKAVIIDSRQEYAIVGRGSHPHFLITSPDRPNQAEQHPSQWTDAILTSVKQAITGLDPSQIAAIAVSGQQHGLVLLDSNRNIIRPSKLWCDTESSNEAHHLSSLFQDPSLVASFTITKIAWVKNQEPDNYTKIINGGLVLLPHDYINYWLTGVECMEPSDASGTGVFDPVTRTWATDRITAIDPKLLAVFPPIIPSSPPQHQSIGTLLPSIAQLLGLPPGIPVGQGGGDNAMTALGVGAVDPGRQVIISLGTSGTLFGPSAAPVIDPLGVICPFCDAAGIGGLPLLCTLNCASAAEEVRIGFGLTREEITQLATAGSSTGSRSNITNSDKDRKEEYIPSPGCHGVTFLPYFVGERSPNWPHASGAIVGLRPGLMTPGLLYRAALEGATFSLVAGLDRLRELTGNDDNDTATSSTFSHNKELLLVGGGSRNTLWRRIICDAFQLPLKFPVEPDSAALGAAYQAAAVGKGIPVAEFIESHARPAMEGEVMQPDESVAGEYREAYERFKKWGGDMFGGRSADL